MSDFNSFNERLSVVDHGLNSFSISQAHTIGLEITSNLRCDETVRLFLLGTLSRHAPSSAEDFRGAHPGTRDFLDRACRTAAVVDLNALAETQIDDVLLSRHLIGERERVWRSQRERDQSKTKTTN
jgi:hypothetical protein